MSSRKKRLEQKRKAKARRKQIKNRQQRVEIRKFGDPVLTEICEPVESRGEFIEIAVLMKRALESAPTGVGLAAPQIGILKRVIVLKKPNMKGWAMANPELTSLSFDTLDTDREGCLSYPGHVYNIERPLYAEVRFMNESWELETANTSGFGARVLQHELDHLEGICLVGDMLGQVIEHELKGMEEIDEVAKTLSKHRTQALRDMLWAGGVTDG